ncbi:MAG: SUMF1/EgtB/PvdO family nonheme iron enzyme [Polyangiaceae bacterium]|nr:SUMF1/EgtB/PvdO family nonheme iron enzyme [Polyangiaceae bacterium]
MARDVLYGCLVLAGALLAPGCELAGADGSDGVGGAGAAGLGAGGLGAGGAGHGALEPGLAASTLFDCEVDGVRGSCRDVGLCVGDWVPVPGHCPGPAEIQCCVPLDPGAVCDPAAAPLPNEGLAEAPGLGGCPAGMTPVADFCIDRYEASLERVDGTGSFSPYHNPGATPVRAVSIAGAVPQGYITGEQADAACAEAGKRLCTDDEWQRACRGVGDTVYPYGDTLELGLCNDHRDVHPAIELFGTSDPWIWSELGNACLNQLPASLAPAGDHPGCVTPEGVYDLMGNLHEWTADPAGTFRGGYYVDTVINGPGCLYATTAHDTGHWDYSTGFRCCY